VRRNRAQAPATHVQQIDGLRSMRRKTPSPSSSCLATVAPRRRSLCRFHLNACPTLFESALTPETGRCDRFFELASASGNASEAEIVATASVRAIHRLMSTASAVLAGMTS
jgi:hypothetical protein